ncbi:MAG: hypothetical protein ABEJ22_01290 [Haloferacaceae archaeon]
MERRQFLAGLGTAGSAALAGCYSLRPDEPPRSVREIPLVEESGPPDLDDPGPVQTSWTVGPTDAPTVGEHRPHGVTLRNAADRARPYALRVVRWSGSGLLDESGTLVANGRVEVTLRGPANHSVLVRSGDLAGRVDVPQSQFDCNTSSTTVVAGDDGLRASTISTQVACGFAWP